MSTPVLDTFQFGEHQVTIENYLYDDMIFFAQEAWCEWLLEHNGWRDLDEACRGLHPDHVKMLADWATIKVEKLPEEIRRPVDGTVRDAHTLIRYLAAALPWKVAYQKLDEAHIKYSEGAPTIASEEAVRAAAKNLIDAALEFPPPYRDNRVQRSLIWADFVDRAWLQGLNIPTPWGTSRSRR
jgi:hypothetical protein